MYNRKCNLIKSTSTASSQRPFHALFKIIHYCWSAQMCAWIIHPSLVSWFHPFSPSSPPPLLSLQAAWKTEQKRDQRVHLSLISLPPSSPPTMPCCSQLSDHSQPEGSEGKQAGSLFTAAAVSPHVWRLSFLTAWCHACLFSLLDAFPTLFQLNH